MQTWLMYTGSVFPKSTQYRLDKLRLIVIIEAELQILFRILLKFRVYEKLEITKALHHDQFGSRINNNLQDLLHTTRFFIDEINYRKTEALLHIIDSKAEYDRMIIQILILYLYLTGIPQNELIWMYFTLLNLSFQIIIQYIKSYTPIYFLHGVGQGIIESVYLWMLSYNVVLSFCNNKHEGARFRNKDRKIIATALAPTCIDN